MGGRTPVCSYDDDGAVIVHITGRVCSNCTFGNIGSTGIFCVALMLQVDEHEALGCDVFERIA